MKRIFKMLLLVFFLIVVFCYTLVIEHIPEEIVVFEGENISFRTLLGMQVKGENDETVETSSRDENKLSEKVGNSKIEVSLFNTIPIKEVNLDVIPKTTVIPVRKYSGGKTLYKWCVSSSGCLK